MDGSSEMATGSVVLTQGLHFDLLTPLLFYELFVAYRTPVPVASFGSITAPFAWPVWGALFATVSALAASLMAAHGAYSSLDDDTRSALVRPVHSKVDFFLFAFAKMSEPDALPWFIGVKLCSGSFFFNCHLTRPVLLFFFGSGRLGKCLFCSGVLWPSWSPTPTVAT